jgi:hypothetical protein
MPTSITSQGIDGDSAHLAGSALSTHKPCSERDSAMSDLIDRYLACWNETDAATRRALIAEHWSDDPTYVDPMVEVHGREALDATIAAVQARFPGLVFTPAGVTDAHHDIARFTWGLGPAGAEPLVIGFDVVVTDGEGRIESVLGFLDRVPA